MPADEVTAWLRQAIEARQALARHAIELGSSAEWRELSSGVLVTGPPELEDAWAGTHPLGDSSLTRLMEANDPRDTLARCEAELALLGAYAVAVAAAGARKRAYDAWALGGRTGPRPVFRGPESTPIAGLERAIGLLAAGYRHWPGFPGRLFGEGEDQ